MALKLKTKVALGGVFLFTLLLLAGIVCFFYFNRITADAREIIKDNYETLDYSREMTTLLDKMALNDSSGTIKTFEEKLRLQEQNITEPGEKERTQGLRRDFELLKNNPANDSLQREIRKDLNAIMQLNLQAISTKNSTAQQYADNAKTIISILLTVCILLGFTFLFSFPSLIASPLAKFMEGIREISNKNYRERINLNRSDEFGELANAFNLMAERLDQYEHSNLSKILFEKQRAETVIHSLKDASIGIDNKGTVLFANQQALRLLHLKDSEIVGRPQDEMSKRNDLFRFLIHEQNSVPFKVVLDGNENYFTKELVEIRQQEDVSGHVIIVKNITPFKERDVAKTNFIATISHELKTPLASSDFSLKLLEDERVGKLSEAQRELVQNLKDDNKRLLKILSELLDLSQVESGKIQLLLQDISAADLASKATASVQNVAKKKNITIKEEIAGDLPAVHADADKTTWVLNNFLANAIRYSPDNGKVIIAVQQKDNKIEFSVRDFGPGVDPAFGDKIFDRYFKTPGAKEGTGLGLAISKEFIEAQGGSIRYETEAGKGSRFSFLLPLSAISK